MNIYSIQEIVKATNDFLKPKAKTIIKKNSDNNHKRLLQNKKKDINSQIKQSTLLEEDLLINNKINRINYKINIKPIVKDHMVNELYLYFTKKIKKNTLKLIIEEQLEIKNLKNKINFLKQNENKLKDDYQILKNNYELVLKDNHILKITSNSFENKLNQFTINKDQLNIENIELKNNINNIKLKLDESILQNRSFEINNAEIKNTISRYIINNKKLQEKINLIENSKNLKSEDETKKIKFYQNENVRLSSELLNTQKNNNKIKENLNDIKIEKEKISNKIKELNISIEDKTNIIPSSFVKTFPDEVKKDINKLNNTEQKSLDEVINRIFAKI